VVRGLLSRRRALAARDHAAFSAMIYVGLRIEETTALTVDDLSFSCAAPRRCGWRAARVTRSG
jgi:site-specific recombinase XerC